MTTGERIKKARLDKGWTQERLGERVGVKKAAINKYEQDIVINLKRSMIAKLADALDVDPVWLIGLGDTDTSSPDIIPLPDLDQYKIPLVGATAAGAPIYDEEWPGEYVHGPVKADFAIRVKGDSMAPDYMDGDLIYVRRMPDVPYEGAVCAVGIDDETTLKHVYRHGDGVMLISNNPAYGPMLYSAAEHLIRILGIPIGFTRIYTQK